MYSPVFHLKFCLAAHNLIQKVLMDHLKIRFRQNKSGICKSLFFCLLRSIAIDIIIKLVRIQNCQIIIQCHLANTTWYQVQYVLVVLQYRSFHMSAAFPVRCPHLVSLYPLEG